MLVCGLWCGFTEGQQLSDLRPPNEPLLLENEGSFYVGGRTVHLTNTGWEVLGPVFEREFGRPGEATVDQMYVQFQKPRGSEGHVPLVFVHGCCLSAKTWETTPDGRMGWNEYFLRKNRSVYLADQVARARSGFDATIINAVKSGAAPASQLPNVLMASHQVSWT